MLKKIKSYRPNISASIGTISRAQTIAYIGVHAAIFFTYLLVSLRYSGPAYLSDEMGYLSKAAAIAGYPSDMASSWHAGYSFLIAPIFALFSDPFLIWKAIMVANTAMWTVSFMALFYILRRLFAQKPFEAILGAVAVSAIYPSWVVMSGYAFSTSAFVVVFMLALAALLKSELKKTPYLLLHSVLIGYLYWIHPVGIAAVAASVGIFVIKMIKERNVWGQLPYVCIPVLMVAAYSLTVHPGLSDLMTPDNYEASAHYRDPSSFTRRVGEVEFWRRWATIFFGQASYLLIATFGVIAVGVWEVITRIKREIRNKDFIKSITNDERSMILLVMILSLLGILIIGSLSFTQGKRIRPDHWIYGRYAEMVILPLIGIGILAWWRFKQFFTAITVVLITGLALRVSVNGANTNLADNNLVNVQSLWPQAFIHDVRFLLWFVMGVGGILLVKVLGKRFALLAIVPIYIIAINWQGKWHSDILTYYSNPSGLVSAMRSQGAEDACIGFDPKMPSGRHLRERVKMYSFYLYEFMPQRMSAEEWLQSSCDYYLTYDSDVFIDNQSATVVGKEESNGLYLVVKAAELAELKGVESRANDFYINTLSEDSELCLVKGCFGRGARQLEPFLGVGRYDNGAIVTQGVAGFLFSGPYVGLAQGDYILTIEGELHNLKGVFIDLKGGVDAEPFFVKKLTGEGESTIKVPFSLKEDISNIEIRLAVSEESDISFKEYYIEVQQ